MFTWTKFILFMVSSLIMVSFAIIILILVIIISLPFSLS
jgi:hypothetical protein